MQTKLEHVKLSDITVSDTNVMFRDEAEMTEDALKELIDSVREKGVIQPVLIRELNGKKILICGERRFRAAKAVAIAIKNRDTIPANIREMTDEEAFELQVTENLQRKDVHPLKEAKAYQYLVEKDPKYTVKELALRFGKSEHYIAIRLKLNDLVPEVKKDYLANKMSLAAALVIARLEPDDQREVQEECQDYGSDNYQPVEDIQDHIERSIMCDLKQAPFKKDDATLNPAMGPCTTCQFRTGANQLFADVKNKDRCTKKACFQIKKDVFALRIIKETVENKPDIRLLGGNGKTGDVIAKFLKEKNAKVLKSNTDFTTYSYNSKRKSVKGLWVSGDKAGTMDSVYLEEKQKESEALSKLSPSEQKLREDIARIEEKLSEDRKADDKIVHEKVMEACKKQMSQQKIGSSKFNAAEETMLLYFMYEHIVRADEDDEPEIFAALKKLKLPTAKDFSEIEESIEEDSDSTKAEKLFKKLQSLTPDERVFLFRTFLFDKYLSSSYYEDLDGFFTQKFAEGLGIPVAKIRKDQEAICKEREAKARARIEELKTAAKPKDKPIDRTQKGLAALAHKQEVEDQVNSKKKTPASGVTNVPKFIEKKKLKDAGVAI
jgi:ParB family chromosome partitioning protein